jgi:hypothetical protein
MKGQKNTPLCKIEVSSIVLMKNAIFLDVTRVVFVGDNVSEERTASFIMVKRISEIGT